MQWTEEALEKIQEIPPFVRNVIKETVESYAKDLGISIITKELLAEIKDKFMYHHKGQTSIGESSINKKQLSMSTNEKLNIGELNRETSHLVSNDLKHYFANEGVDPLKYAFDRKFAVHAGTTGLQVPRDMIHSIWNNLINDTDINEKRVIYIHIPFCVSRCVFCGFYMYQFKNEDSKRYVDALIDEIKLISDKKFIKSKPFNAVYLGGGTPTTLYADDLKRLIKAIKNMLPLANDCEITLEARVYGFDDQKIEASIEGGINRYSIGIQSFDTFIRQSLGRKATKDETLEFLNKLTSYGHAPVIIDLIYGLPGQDFKVWQNDILTMINETKVDGCDLYQLNIFKGGMLEKAIRDGRIPSAADIPTQAEMFSLGRKIMYEHGFRRISMSHWARSPRERNIYNNYVRYGATCIPLGAGSGGKIGYYQFFQEGDLKKYHEAIQKREKPIISMRQLPKENDIFREIAGEIEDGKVNLGLIGRKFNVDLVNFYRPILKQWERAGLIEMSNDGIIRLTIAGEFWNVNLTQILIDYYLSKHNSQ